MAQQLRSFTEAYKTSDLDKLMQSFLVQLPELVCQCKKKSRFINGQGFYKLLLKKIYAAIDAKWAMILKFPRKFDKVKEIEAADKENDAEFK